MKEYKIRLFGDVGVGKTSLVVQLMEGRFVDCQLNFDEEYRKRVTLDGETCFLEVFDPLANRSAESNEMRSREKEGFLFVFSITSKKSFEAIKTLREQILRVNGVDTVPMVLVGNKSDLQTERKVTKVEGKGLAKVYSCPFFETSVKMRWNVEESFFELVREIRKSSGWSSERMNKSCSVL
eukprot:TRINITY_DN1730_c0_g1_i1.p1 TRINITY_DN1730_c0_g1~~TRINITY_DN1730_c0_g1_i1.p1  ORF type:complete len:181 (+),score=50.97 TRINITY_DN1730_c0_g1_i1:896-1438(+)